MKKKKLATVKITIKDYLGGTVGMQIEAEPGLPGPADKKPVYTQAEIMGLRAFDFLMKRYVKKKKKTKK
jgi:hypothetical protein